MDAQGNGDGPTINNQERSMLDERGSCFFGGVGLTVPSTEVGSSVYSAGRGAVSVMDMATEDTSWGVEVCRGEELLEIQVGG